MTHNGTSQRSGRPQRVPLILLVVPGFCRPADTRSYRRAEARLPRPREWSAWIRAITGDDPPRTAVTVQHSNEVHVIARRMARSAAAPGVPVLGWHLMQTDTSTPRRHGMRRCVLPHCRCTGDDARGRRHPYASSDPSPTSFEGGSHVSSSPAQQVRYDGFADAVLFAGTKADRSDDQRR